MFMMIPCRVAIIELVLKKNEVRMEPSEAEFRGVTSCINAAAVLCAVGMNKLENVLELNGAFTGSLVALILPPLFEIIGKKKTNYKIDNDTLILNIVMILVGCYTLITGV
mmetsp:Transcript_57159/g.124316  ORF Transcript_57159/g.124316 Transcript_57159/m.124316 type:complete len:110 (-) Transcript_57159:55-384(-)